MSSPASASWIAVNLIRNQSKAGRLTTRQEIEGELERHGLLPSQASMTSAEWERTIRSTMEQHRDLSEVPGHDGLPRYFSATYLSEAYATILIRREEGPFSLIADTVRESSAIYPRPVPLDLFQNPPFGMSDEEIRGSLQEMKELEPYQDIAQTTTSIGSVFLYSTRHLDPDYASLLAEWLDVGQSDHP